MKINSMDNTVKTAFSVSLLLFVLRLVYVSFGPVDLSPDEAHYWEWSRYLDLSYYSKPPMVAWMNYISTFIFGHTHLGVRFFSCLALSVLSFIAFLMAKNAAGNKAGWVALLLINITPEFAAGGLMLTPDIPSLTCWAIALYMLSKLDFSKNEISLKTFIIIGFVIGIAGLSKYTTAIFYPLLGVYLLMDKQRRSFLLRPHVYVAGVVSLVMQIPVLYWNYKNDFIGLMHVMGQSSGSADFSGLKSLGNFLGSQLGVLSPITFLLLLGAWIVMGIALFKGKKEDSPKQKTLELLWYFSAPLFAAFLLKSLGAKVQANWPVLAIYPGLIFLAIIMQNAPKFLKGTFVFGLAFSLLLTIISHDTFIVRKGLELVGSSYKLPFKKDPLKPALGWRGLGQAISSLVNTEDAIILTTRYQTASEMAFYLKGNPEVIYVNPGYRRQNQYDLWVWPEDINSRAVIYVKEKGTIEPFILKAFKGCAHLGEVASRRDTVLMRTANVYSCFGLKDGFVRPRPEVY